MSKIIWEPSPEFIKNSNLNSFLKWINKHYNLNIDNYEELWNWSVSENQKFWESILIFFDIDFDGEYKLVYRESKNHLAGDWFEGIKLNYAEHIFKNKNDDDIAIIFENESGTKNTYSWLQLKKATGAFYQFLKSKGISENDCVCCFAPNTPEALICFLATNAIGATWSSCSPDFGTKSVIERFEQIEPKILIGVNSYYYNGKKFDKTKDVNEILSAIPSIQTTILFEYFENDASPKFKHEKLKNILNSSNNTLEFKRVNFNHPMWVLYSSGTTGKPKAITHSVGGILLEHYKAMFIHQNIKPKERFFWFSTTGWMMWNYANSCLLTDGVLAIYDGSPTFPNFNRLWEFAHKHKINHFGGGASYYISCMKQNIDFESIDISSIKSFGSTGSPLSEEAFEWLNKINKKAWIISLSGGTDICSGFVGGNPFKAVKTGEIQCRMLGVNLKAYNEEGKEVIDELGEMVIENHMPSMPIFFWNDENNKRYFESYFDVYSGVWRHGDFIKITKDKSVIIYGRSDSTLNRGGVRIGTSEIYSTLENISSISDSLIVCLDLENGQQEMPLFVKMKNHEKLDEETINQIKTSLRKSYSPRHVPDFIIQVDDIPYTLSGKKMETPIKKILMGKSSSDLMSKDAMKNPESINMIMNAYNELKSKR